MPPRVVRLPSIERIDLPLARQSVPPLHAYLRECILDGRLPPGTKLSQATLADQLGVSRTPLREVLRMLQEEGLISAEPNQRMRVAGLDPAELDSDFAARILIGTLALSMTMDSFGAAQRRAAQQLLSRMRKAARRKDVDDWLDAHVQYHGLLDAGAPEPLQRQLQVLADRSVRYIRILQHDEPAAWTDAGDVEHPAILDAIARDDRQPRPVRWPTTWPERRCACCAARSPSTTRSPCHAPSPSSKARAGHRLLPPSSDW